MALSPIGKSVRQTMGLTPQTQLTLSPIGQKVREKQEVTFGIPAFSESDHVPSFDTETSTEPTRFTFELPQEEVADPDAPRFSFSGGATISQGDDEPDAGRPPGRDIPFVGKFLFGGGEKTDMHALYTPGSFQQDIVDKGIIGWFMEGFSRETNPTKSDVADKIMTRYTKATESGNSAEESLQLAVQDTINNTPGTAKNIADLRNPEIELTAEEKDLFKWTNRIEDFFAVMDAPIFMGATKPITKGLKVLPKYLDELTTGINKAFHGAEDVVRTPETEDFIIKFTQTKAPSVNQLDDALLILKEEGANVTKLQTQLDDIAKTVASEPTRFLDDAKSLADGTLSEVADPAAHKLGTMSKYLQTRYGEAVVNTKNIDKIALAEKQTFNSINGYAKEAREILNADGSLNDMVQNLPKWVPDQARNVSVFENVSEMIQKGEIPNSHASPEMLLYNSMIDEFARKAGIKTTSGGAIDGASAALERLHGAVRKTGSTDVPIQKPVSTKKVSTEGAAEFKESIEKQIFEQEGAVTAYNQYVGAIRNSRVPPAYRESLQKLVVDFKELTDISKFKGKIKDAFRNSEAVFGEQWPVIKKAIFDPLDKSKGKMWAEAKAKTDEVQRYIVEELGITRKSKKSRAVMDYGEAGLGRAGDELLQERLVREWGEKGAKDVRDAAVWFRKEYDQMLDDINRVRQQLYPNNAERQIPRRQDYFRHYRELSDFSGIRNAFESVSQQGTDANLAALGEIIKPNKTWQSFEQVRKGNKSERDALGGYLEYVPNYVYAKHIDPHIGVMRGFAKKLDEGTKESGIATNYIEFLNLYADDLAGLINPADRFIGNWMPGGRKALDVLDWFNKRAKINAILGNASASISQIGNVPNSIASAQQHSVHGAIRSLGDIFNSNPAWKESDFINGRYGQSMYNQFSVGMLENTRDFAGWMIQALDEVGTKFSFNAHYEKAIRQGIEDPVKYADDMARKMNGGRDVGDVPLIQKSKAFQIVAPFQLEVANAWFVLGEFMSKKEFSKIATLMVASYSMNRVSEEVRGSGITFDMGEALYESYKIVASEDTYKEKGIKIGGRLSGEVLNNLPVVPYAVAAIYPEEGGEILGVEVPTSAEFFGEGDPLRYGISPLLLKSLQTPLFSFATPFGGKQIKKTLEGVGALADGNVQDKDGNVLMDVEDGPATALQNVLFGKWQPNIHNKEKLEEEMAVLARENMTLAADGNTEQANANVADLPDKVFEVYKDQFASETGKAREREKRLMMPTLRTLDALSEEKRDSEVDAILEGMTDEEYEMYGEIREEQRKEDSADRKYEELHPESMIQEALDYSYAFGTNPVQAFEIVFKNHEHIEDVVGGSVKGVVRTRRMPFLGAGGSAEFKESLGAGKGSSLFLEHIIPLGMGGSNQPDNLMLYRADDHNASTPVENYLTKSIKDKTLPWEKGHEIILKYRQSVEDGETMTLKEIKSLVNSI